MTSTLPVLAGGCQAVGCATGIAPTAGCCGTAGGGSEGVVGGA